jgi:hypothetical protein
MNFLDEASPDGVCQESGSVAKESSPLREAHDSFDTHPTPDHPHVVDDGATSRSVSDGGAKPDHLRYCWRSNQISKEKLDPAYSLPAKPRGDLVERSESLKDRQPGFHRIGDGSTNDPKGATTHDRICPLRLQYGISCEREPVVTGCAA